MEGDGLTLVTWFHGDEPGRSGTYAQTLGDAASPAHYDIYLRCVDVCMASFRRWNPEARALVVLNDRAAVALHGSRRAFWEQIGLECAVVSNAHRPSTDLYSRWQNQTFVFDVIAAACDRATGSASIAVIDSDVVIRRSLADLPAAVRRGEVLSMQVPFSVDQDVHGLTREDLGRLHEEWSGRTLGFVPAYRGGEFVAGSADALRRMLVDVESVYRWCLSRQAAGRLHPHEEAQMMSIARPTPVVQAGTQEWIGRIWTQPWTRRVIPPSVGTLPMWHLPAEKKTGLRRLHGASRNADSWFWCAPPDEWQRRVGLAVGVPTYGMTKAVRDGAALAHRLPVAAVHRAFAADRPGDGVP